MTGATNGQGMMPANGILNFNEGLTTVTQTVFDMAGNATQCVFTVSLTGVAKPHFVLPGISVECGSGQQVINVTVFDFKNVNGFAIEVNFDNSVVSIDSVKFNPLLGPCRFRGRGLAAIKPLG